MDGITSLEKMVSNGKCTLLNRWLFMNDLSRVLNCFLLYRSEPNPINTYMPRVLFSYSCVALIASIVTALKLVKA